MNQVKIQLVSEAGFKNLGIPFSGVCGNDYFAADTFFISGFDILGEIKSQDVCWVVSR